MKKVILYLFAALLSLGLMPIIASCSEENFTGEENFTVEYSVEEGGDLFGNALQTVPFGGQTEEVEVRPWEGYYFVGWSDEAISPKRREENVTSNQVITAKFEKFTYQISYLTDGNGTIEGEATQKVKYMDLSTSVKAVPNEGYRFVKWSDLQTSPKREDRAVKNMSLTAEFEEIVFRFHYDYKFATGNCANEGVEIYYWSYQNTDFPVPTREHFRFKGWYFGDKQVTNESGKPLANASEFPESETTLTAKWEPIDTFTYKILMVYAQEVHATLKSYDESEEIKVDYQMTELQHKVCNLITVKFQETLNDYMDGLVRFEVDEYFLKKPLGSKDFFFSSVGWMTYPSRIAEVQELSKKYQSTLLTCCLNDWDHKLYHGTLRGNDHEGFDHLEDVFLDTMVNDEPIENLLDKTFWRWKRIIDHYVTSFIGTIEWRAMKSGLLLRDVTSAYYERKIYDSEVINRDFLLGRAYVNGKYVGIPYEFWAAEEKKYSSESN